MYFYLYSSNTILYIIGKDILTAMSKYYLKIDRINVLCKLTEFSFLHTIAGLTRYVCHVSEFRMQWVNKVCSYHLTIKWGYGLIICSNILHGTLYQFSRSKSTINDFFHIQFYYSSSSSSSSQSMQCLKYAVYVLYKLGINKHALLYQ